MAFIPTINPNTLTASRVAHDNHDLFSSYYTADPGSDSVYSNPLTSLTPLTPLTPLTLLTPLTPLTWNDLNETRDGQAKKVENGSEGECLVEGLGELPCSSDVIREKSDELPIHFLPDGHRRTEATRRISPTDSGVADRDDSGGDSSDGSREDANDDSSEDSSDDSSDDSSEDSSDDCSHDSDDSSDNDDSDNNHTPQYLLETTQKGRGVFAATKLKIGTRIMHDHPLLTCSQDITDDRLCDLILACKLLQLPKSAQRSYLSLHNSFRGIHKFVFAGIFDTNALPCGSLLGVYPLLSLINHSCLPNAFMSWNSRTSEGNVYALRTIAKGEEITIAYLISGGTTRRRVELYIQYGFICECEACSLEGEERTRSDIDRILLDRLLVDLGDHEAMVQDPRRRLSDCRAMLYVADIEFAGHAAIVYRVYYQAFELAAMHGDAPRAKAFARRAYSASLVCRGREHPKTLLAMAYSLQPHLYPRFASEGVYDGSEAPAGRRELEAWLWECGGDASVSGSQTWSGSENWSGSDSA